MDVGVIYLFFIMKRVTKILMFNVHSVVLFLTGHVKRVFEENSENLNYVNGCVDYCINKSLEEIYLVNIINIPQCPFYDTVWNKVKYDLAPYLSNVISFGDLNELKDNQVKTMCNGLDLFITTVNDYEQY